MKTRNGSSRDVMLVGLALALLATPGVRFAAADESSQAAARGHFRDQ